IASRVIEYEPSRSSEDTRGRSSVISAFDQRVRPVPDLDVVRVVKSITRRSGPGKGSGRRSAAYTTLKIVVDAPIPSASVRTAATEVPRIATSDRTAYRRSRMSRGRNSRTNCYPTTLQSRAMKHWFIGAGLVSLVALARTSSTSYPHLFAQPDPNTIVDLKSYQDLRWRTIGPHRGGRSTAAAGVRTQPNGFYMGATGGGVWEDEDFGVTWAPVGDGQIGTGSIGAIDVADSNPNIVYVGTGSEAIRSNVILGRGVYKSADAGRTWQFVGLKDVGQIGQIKIHPRNPDVAFVAAIGNPFGWGPDRGVFRTKDGGKTWQKVLF